MNAALNAVIFVCVVLAFLCFGVLMPWSVMCSKEENQSRSVCTSPLWGVTDLLK